MQSYPVEGAPWDIESTPWGAEAAYRAEEESVSLEEARDAVILRYLIDCGDVRPLKALLSLGIAPGPVVLHCLAFMINSDPAKNKPDPADKLRFEITAKGINGNKKSDGTLLWRDLIVARNVTSFRKKKVKYEAAISEVAREAEISVEHVRKIHDEAYRIAKGRKMQGG